MKKSLKKKESSDSSAGKIYLSLFWEFLKIGLFTIGGGMAMIPQLQSIAVEEKKWLDEEDMIDCVAVSQALPGVIAINAATYIGMRLRGVKGALASTLGVITPSFTIIILAVTILDNIGENSYIQGAFTGIKAAVCGLILVTVVKMGRKILRSWFSWIMAVLAFAAVIIFGVNAAWVILAGIAAGIVYSTVMLKIKNDEAQAQTGSDAASEAAAETAETENDSRGAMDK